MTSADPSVLVAGGGIGGLTAALAFAGLGIPVRVLEQAEAFSEVGAGIQLSPNATRVLHHLGLEDALRAVSFVPLHTEMRHWRNGRVISRNDLGEQMVGRFGAPYYHVHRADLIGVLETACRAHPDIELLLDTRVDDVVDDGEGVTVATPQGEQRGRLLVGADGIHSVVRSVLFGRQDPVYTGNVAWRALIPSTRLPDGLVRPGATVWMGPGRHFVHYYVRGGDLVNCVCVVETGPRSEGEVESWTRRGEHGELQRDFAGWHADIGTLIGAMDPDACFKWALYDREPMTQWGRGRITLLGDACHPTLPFMAQGAAMAIEDAIILARCVIAEDDDELALGRYGQLRRDRTASVQRGSRRNARIFHLRGLAAWARNRALTRARKGILDELYRYDALSAVPLD